VSENKHGQWYRLPGHIQCGHQDEIERKQMSSECGSECGNRWGRMLYIQREGHSRWSEGQIQKSDGPAWNIIYKKYLSTIDVKSSVERVVYIYIIQGRRHVF